VTIGVECWRCEKPGHFAAECQPPPAATRKELDARIKRLVERWDAGHGITTAQKQAWIKDEIRKYEKETAKK
jgi:hypothetical protein